MKLEVCEGTFKRKTVSAAMLLIAISVLALIAAQNLLSMEKPSSLPKFFVGVESGWKASVSDVKALIDKVKDYTNLLVLAYPTITADQATLYETCDYAYDAGMYFSVHFNNNNYSDTNPPVINVSQFAPYEWVVDAKQRYGDQFLGVYFNDEVGGFHLDNSTRRAPDTVSPTERPEYFVNRTADRMYVLRHYTRAVGASMFTADYALYWFDYKAGYDAVFAEFAWNNSETLQVALTRGAARVQNKDWGIMVTWTYGHPPYLESGPQLYSDLVFAYNSGAKYLVIYDASHGYENSTLTEEHYDALKDFWEYAKQNPTKQGTLKADTVLILPPEYGTGFREPNDSVWGYKRTDLNTQKLYEDVYALLAEHGSSLDIIYDDPEFTDNAKASYNSTIFWSG